MIDINNKELQAKLISYCNDYNLVIDENQVNLLLKHLDLVLEIKYEGTIKNCDINFVTDDSRKVCKGCAFVCSKGENFDGHSFAEKAVKLGASLIVAEHDTGVENQIIVENSKKVYALLCGNLFDNPARKMKMIGITGTNGKTTST